MSTNGLTSRSDRETRFEPRAESARLERRDIHLGPEPLTFVSAPIGFGKTTVLAQWYDDACRAGRQPLWLRVGPGYRSEVELIWLVEELIAHHAASGSTPSQRVLFVDQADELQQDAVDFLANSCESKQWPWAQVVVASRRLLQPPFGVDIEALRVVSSRGLRLPDAIVLDVLRFYKPELRRSDAMALVNIIDGWSHAAHIAGSVIAASCDISSFVNGFGGRDREVRRLFDEVLKEVSRSDRDFLMHASALANLDPYVCDEVLKTSGSVDRLSRLASRHVLMEVQEDGSIGWVPLAQEFLLDELDARYPGARDGIRLGAVRHLLASDKLDEAIEYALEGSEWQEALSIISNVGLQIVASGQARRLSSWLSNIPAPEFVEHPDVSIIGAVAAWAVHGSDGCELIRDWLATASRALPASRLADGTPLDVAIDVAMASFCPLDAAKRQRLAARVVDEHTGPSTVWLALALATAGTAAYVDDDPVAANRALTRCLRVHRDLDAAQQSWVGQLVASTAYGTLALIECDSGESNRADILLSTASMGENSARSLGIGTGASALAQARATRRDGQLCDALGDLERVFDRARIEDIRVLASLEAASICAELDRPQDVARHLRRADRAMSRFEHPGRLLAKRRRLLERQLHQPASVATSVGEALSDRELEVLKLLESDLSRREMATELFLAHNTVKTYIQRLYQKLDVSSRSAAVARARTRGWI